jgi:hypothetical protein
MSHSKEELSLIVITSLCAAQVLHETLDDLEETQYYRQSLKIATKKLQIELTKVCDQNIDKLYGIDDETMRVIQDGITEVSKQLATMNPARIAVLGDLLKNGEIDFEK